MHSEFGIANTYAALSYPLGRAFVLACETETYQILEPDFFAAYCGESESDRLLEQGYLQPFVFDQKEILLLQS
jgi:hypothetical protein